MDAEIRPVGPGELETYVRAIPGVAGLPTWEPEPASWWAGPGPVSPFGGMPSDADVAAAVASVTEPERVRAAFAGGRLVGTSAMLSLELTVPGAGPVPMGGVTSVGVLATHRRQGLLRAMMRALLDDSRARGEALAGLSASEGSIYGRYGFGPATYAVRWELGRAPAGLAGEPGVDIVEREEAVAAFAALHERVRRSRIGEISAFPGMWEGKAGTGDEGRDGVRRFVVFLGASGVEGGAIYRLPWSPDRETAGTVQVEWLEAATDVAYRGLWAFLCDLDLTKRVVAGKRPVDEPLRWLLRDWRAVRVTTASDALWVRLVDVGAALAGRTYEVEGSFRVAVTDEFCPWNDGVWLVSGGPGGSTCVRDSGEPDVAMGAAALGAVYLGGTGLGPLARAGLVRELVPGALARVTAMLGRAEAPFTAIGF